MPPSLASIAARSLLGAALAWAAIGFGDEVRAHARACSAAAPQQAPALEWRFGTPPVERLRALLDAAHRLLPPGALVGFAPAPGCRDEEAFFQRLWAAYLAPDLNVVGEDQAHAYTRYLIAGGALRDRPETRLLLPLPGGALYRIGPP
jgi:hypothetical protein